MAKKKIGIIGGGISGAGLAYHLSLYEGEADVTVFEKDTIGGASTAKSAGTVCLFDDSLKNRYWDVRLYGFESYLKMEEEEKGSAGFDKTGTLVVATNEEVEKVIKTGIALAKAAGYTGEYITDKDRIKEILPDISTENILGAGYTEDDGYFDGTMISNTYMKKAQKNGVTVKTGVKVTDVKIVDNKVKGLKSGSILLMPSRKEIRLHIPSTEIPRVLCTESRRQHFYLQISLIYGSEQSDACRTVGSRQITCNRWNRRLLHRLPSGSVGC